MDFVGQEEVSKDSMRVSFRCPGCEGGVSMVTNPGETQLVYSLGVKLGGKSEAKGADKGTHVKPLELTRTTLKTRGPGAEEKESPVWTPGAEKRLNNVPSFIRPMARRAVEGLAAKKGVKVIDEALMDEAKGKFMGE